MRIHRQNRRSSHQNDYQHGNFLLSRGEGEKHFVSIYVSDIYIYIYNIYVCVCIVDSIHAGDIPYHVYPRPNIILK